VFFDLFAFGGILQAAAIMWLLLGAAAFGAAVRRGPRARWLSAAGAACVGLGALTHMGTAVIAVPVGVQLAVLSSVRATPKADERWRRLLPLVAVLGGVAVVWLLVLLPGSTELARNPASLAYRGPERLMGTLVSYWPSRLVIALGAAGVTAGAWAEVRRRRHGTWTMLASWSATTLVVVAASVVSGASTDYPRFATPIMAPLIVAVSGVLAVVLGRAAGMFATWTGHGQRRAWAVGIVAVTVVAATPWTVIRFTDQVRGYALADAAGLDDVAAWVETNLPEEATILAPVREAKWLEGLTGRAALFSGAIRYSFRPIEWQRSLAADTLLRGSRSLANPYFVARFSDPNPLESAPRIVTLSANHGGEYVDLLRTLPAATTIGRTGGGVAARLANMPSSSSDAVRTAAAATSTMRWEGDRADGTVAYRQSVTLLAGGSTLEVAGETSGTVGPSGITLALRASGDVPLVSASGGSHELILTFAQLGSGIPQLRLVAGDGANLVVRRDGTILVRGVGPSVRMTVTDLSGSPIGPPAASVLQPTSLLQVYGVRAAVLPRDGLLATRQARLEALGFHLAADFGSYLVFDR
jgi:hypothetical protein